MTEAPEPPVASAGTSSQPNAARIVLLAMLVIILAWLGLSRACSAFGASVARHLQFDTTGHLAKGSAVYLGDVRVAAITRVVVMRADTSWLKTGMKGIDTIATRAAQGMPIYVASEPTDSAIGATLRSDESLTARISGQYGDTTPVRIFLNAKAERPGMPTAYLKFPSRRQLIFVY